MIMELPDLCSLVSWLVKVIKITKRVITLLESVLPELEKESCDEPTDSPP